MSDHHIHKVRPFMKMNDTVKNQPEAIDASAIQYNICEVCQKNNEEDLYIIFKLLYRALLGDDFHHNRARSQQDPEAKKSTEEKIKLFRENMSCEILNEIILSSQFDQLLREIFKSKYASIEETTCSHQVLVKDFIQNFNIFAHLKFENLGDHNEKTSQLLGRLDTILSSIYQLKDDLCKYHSEINKLSSHVISRLFNQQTQEAEEEKSVTKKNARQSDFGSFKPTEKKIKTENMNHSSDSTAANSGNTGSFSGGNGSGSGSDNLDNQGSGSNQSNESDGDDDNDNDDGSEKMDDSPSQKDAGKGRRRSKPLPFKSKLPKKATDVLRQWFLSNLKHPYPTHEDKEVLSKATGLTRKQIQNWFTNTRKRFLEPVKKKIGDQQNEGSPYLESSLTADQPVEEQQSRPNVTNNMAPQATLEPVNLQQNSQIKTLPQLFTTIPNIQAAPTLKPMIPQGFTIPIPQQQFQPQIQSQFQNQFQLHNQPQLQPQQLLQAQPQGQPLFYQGLIPMGGMQPGSNFIMLPYVIPQPQLLNNMRPPEMLSMNTPQFIQLQPGNIPMLNQPFMLQNPMMNNNQYLVPLQQNNGEMRNPIQNLAANYNTINNNVYNNINNMASLGSTPTFANFAGLNNLPQTPSVLSLNVDSNFNRSQDGPFSAGKSGQNEMFTGNFEDGSRELKNI